MPIADSSVVEMMLRVWNFGYVGPGTGELVEWIARDACAELMTFDEDFLRTLLGCKRTYRRERAMKADAYTTDAFSDHSFASYYCSDGCLTMCQLYARSDPAEENQSSARTDEFERTSMTDTPCPGLDGSDGIDGTDEMHF